LPLAVRMERTAAGGTVLFAGYDMLVAHGTPPNAWLFQNLPKAWPALYWGAGVKDGKAWRVPSATETEGSQSNACHTLRLAPMRSLDGAFPHRCWFVFGVTNTSHELSVLPPRETISLTAAATSPCRVFFNGQEIGRTQGWKTPVEQFGSAAAKGKNTLLFVFDPFTDPKSVPAAIAAICGPQGALETGPMRWQARPLTTEEAAQDPAAILAASGWHRAKALDLGKVPSRENTHSVLEDLPPQWFTSEVDAGKPVLALRLAW
jgi:hypothetical protein